VLGEEELLEYEADSGGSDGGELRTVPEVGRSRMPMMCSSVDFPDPDGPMIAANSPWLMVRLTLSSATTGGCAG
jgi:hypothetical protein